MEPLEVDPSTGSGSVWKLFKWFW